MGKLLLETFVQILTNSLDHSSDSCEMIFHNISVCQNVTTQKEALCFPAHIYEHATEHSGVNYCSPCSQVMLHCLAQLDIQTERKIPPWPKFVLCVPSTSLCRVSELTLQELILNIWLEIAQKFRERMTERF